MDGSGLFGASALPLGDEMTEIDYGSMEYEELLRQAMRFERVLRYDLRDDQPEAMAELEQVKLELARRKPSEWRVDYDQRLKDL